MSSNSRWWGKTSQCAYIVGGFAFALEQGASMDEGRKEDPRKEIANVSNEGGGGGGEDQIWTTLTAPHLPRKSLSLSGGRNLFLLR